MASLVPGYDCDIFTSYRQKDNKGNHWVTEFDYAMRIELEPSFKEDVLFIHIPITIQYQSRLNTRAAQL